MISNEFDVILVSYNSSKWIDGCFTALSKLNYDLSKINIVMVDNCSKDDSVNKVREWQQKNIGFGSIQIVENKKNTGFGHANNVGVKQGKSPYLFILNIDTEIKEDTLSILNQRILASKEEFKVWECKQVPFEHPKYYDPVTLETSWASGACVVIDRSVFERIGGFDDRIFMYAEDVDISWAIRRLGYKIMYAYDACVVHHSYSDGKFKEVQFFNSIINNLYLRSKYSTIRKMLGWHKMFFKLIFGKELRWVSGRKFAFYLRRKLVAKWLKILPIVVYTYFTNRSVNKKFPFKPIFHAFDYEHIKVGFEDEIFDLLETGPLVSIIVRTYQRNGALLEALKSIEQQAYKNIEVIVVEDGPQNAGNVIEEMKDKLNIRYFPINDHKGRSVAGNIGLQEAKGEYLCFLDDDDALYPDHISYLVEAATLSSSYKIVYATAFETAQEIIDEANYTYEIKEIGVKNNHEFSLRNLAVQNLFPIQTVLFHHSVYDELGGFDETQHYLEDWDLWVRFATKNYFYSIKKTTSVYRVPYQNVVRAERQMKLDESLKYFENKFNSYQVETTMFTIRDQVKNG